MQPQGQRWLILMVWLWLGMAARLYHIQTQSIWFDEGWSAYAAAQPTLLGAVEADPTNPPLYYVSLNILASGFGDSPFALRYVSLLFGLLVIALAYRLGQQLFNSRAGIAGAALTALSPLLWWASQEARMYTLLAALVLLTAAAWHRVIGRAGRTAWLVLWAGELALLYAHNTGPVIVLWLNLVTVVIWLLRRSLRRPDWRVWFGGQVVVALAWSPWLVGRFLLVPGANSGFARDPQPIVSLLSRMWQALWAGPWAMVDKEPFALALAGAILLLAILLLPWRKPAARWLVLHGGALTGGLALGLGLLGSEMHGRYLAGGGYGPAARADSPNDHIGRLRL
jgi:uncharacterized membrane protein